MHARKNNLISHLPEVLRQFFLGFVSLKFFWLVRHFIGCKVPFVAEMIAVPFAFGGLGYASAGMYVHFLFSSPTFGLPTLAAYTTWKAVLQDKSWLDAFMHLLFPLICIGAFYLSPHVGAGFVYSAYWLIPPACWMLRQFLAKDSLWLISLSTSFVAHAAGSVLWVYLFPTSPLYWISLIPTVAHERLFIAALCYAAARLCVLSSPQESTILPGQAEEGAPNRQYPL